MLPAKAQVVPENALPFTRSYLLTGNYAVMGVDLAPQAADCTTFAPDCYAKGSITVSTCPTTGPITPGSCIPDGADVVAAWMYYESLASDPAAVPKARFRPAGGSYQTLTKARRSDVSLPSQASCLSSSGGSLTLSMNSVDVLRFFPFRIDSASKPTALRNVIGTHDIALAEVGTGNNARQGAGASLFFVYRLPAPEKLRKVVVYDGAYLQYPVGTVMNQQLRGFYQSWTGNQSAWLTHIVGSGAQNTSERILFNDAPIATEQVSGVDPVPFPLGSNQGGSGSDRAWANPTIDVTGKMVQTDLLTGFGETASTAVDHGSNNPYECMSWAAIIFSTVVKDADADGLPDGLEGATSGLKDPNPDDLVNAATPAGRPLPNLNAMGALVGPRDLLLEVNGLWAPPGWVYGHADAPYSIIRGITSLPPTTVRHDHLPTPAVIKLLGDAFADAPTPISLHVDVGNITTYKSRTGFGSSEADKYLVCQHNPETKACTGSLSDARGGEVIKEGEKILVNGKEKYCNDTLQTQDEWLANSLGCHFPYFPGTVGWKFGFQHYRDEAVDEETGEELTMGQEDQCYSTGRYTAADSSSRLCRRRFDPIRTGLFHYFLYAHALGIPKGKPCWIVPVPPPDPPDPNQNVDADFNGTDTNGNGVCTSGRINNPNFHVPKSSSGVADSPGGNGLISVGLWDQVNHVGSPFLVAATSFHELGHNFDLSHGGRPPTWGNSSSPTTFEPNCKPNYPSVMSYLFQINGLMDLNGIARIDFSRGVYGDTGYADPLEQTFLHDSLLYDGELLLPDASLATKFQYRPAWFVPVATGSLAEALGVQPATRYCNGVKFGSSVPSPPMGRFDGPGLSSNPQNVSLVDWDLTNSTTTAGQDVNFDGVTGAYQGFNDWLNVRLDQMGAGKNPAGFSLGVGGFEFGVGGFDFGVGGFEFGVGGFDFGVGGFEFGTGAFEFGVGGFEFGVGGFDFGDGSFTFGVGGFDFGVGGFDFGVGGFDFGVGGFDFGNDIDYDQVRRNGHTPPLTVAATVINAPNTPLHHRVRVTWSPPNVGTPSSYKVYRALGATINDPGAILPVCGVADTPSCPTGTTFDDTEELPFNQDFTYFVRAVYNASTGVCNAQVEKCESGPSNFAKVTAENTAPVAVNDPPDKDKWNLLENQASPLPVFANDTDVDSATRTKWRIRVMAPPAHGSVTQAADGTVIYTPAPNYSGTDSFTYQVDNGTWRTTAIKMSDWSATATVTFTVKNKK